MGAGLAATVRVSVVLNRAVGSRGVRSGDQMGPQGSRRWDRWLLVIPGQEPRMSFGLVSSTHPECPVPLRPPGECLNSLE